MTSTLGIIITAIVGGLLPALVWLFFWLNEDRKKPEPKGNLLQAFLVGAIAVIIAFFLEQPFLALLGPLSGTAIPIEFSLATIFLIISQSKLIIAWSAIEEGVKYLGARITVLERPEFDEPVDAMIYLITVALGFAAMENALFLFDILSKGQDHIYFILTGHLRFLGATVVHTVSSATIGAAIALSFYKPQWQKAVIMMIGLFTAILLHALFTFFIINNNGEATAQVLLALWLAAIFIIFLFERVKIITKSHEKYFKL